MWAGDERLEVRALGRVEPARGTEILGVGAPEILASVHEQGYVDDVRVRGDVVRRRAGECRRFGTGETLVYGHGREEAQGFVQDCAD